MAWITLNISTDAAHAESLSDALMALGALSVDIHDAAADTQGEQMLFGEPGEPGGEIWQNAEISALFDQAADIDAIVHLLADTLSLAQPLQYSVNTVEPQDWVRLTQAQFEPIQISPRLWIVPTWHALPDPGAINLILDPGLAFGTGSHPTTQLCLSWLDQHVQSGDRVLDYGCGSGILAIAALKLGACDITGIDIDPQAVEASINNATHNRCDLHRFMFAAPDRIEIDNASMDIVVANILANPLQILAPVLAQAVRPGGHIVLSGILQQQAEEVIQTYQPWFDMSAANMQEGWVLLTGCKKMK
ncbi:MAG: 50S ribosomal protein L11 methyltransferase [Nitrosomonas sp.]|nr:MAG: 50S ribosomal protein L11 methyltransferase [Nitrosomonas sp.]